jgi:TRAP-type C4-dicarboxylate transport system permease small subunit
VAYQGTVLAITVIPQKSAALRLSFFWPYMSIPFGAGLMIIQLLLVAVRDFLQPETVAPDELESGWERSGR